jgi:spermidine synthase
MVVGMLIVALAVLRLIVVSTSNTNWMAETHRLVAGASLVAMTIFMVLSPGWDRVLLHSGLYRTLEHKVGSAEEFKRSVGDLKFLYERDDAEASVAVVENDLGRRLLRVNGKSDAGNHRDVPTQVMVGQMPFFFHEAPKRVLIVGLGSGISVGSVLAHDVEHVDVVEISPAIAEASRLFDAWSHAPLDDPRVHLHIRDARNFMRVLPEDVRYDIIVSEPSNPWQPGSAALFSLEYYELLKSRLAEGGVISQWVHTYEMDDDVLEVIMRTFGRSFPMPRVWTSRGNDMVMVAADGPLQDDLKHMASVLAQPKVAAEMSRIMPGEAPMSLEYFLLHEVMGPRQFRATWGASEDAVIHTDAHPVLQYQAPQSFFVGANATAFRRKDARHLPRTHSGLLFAKWSAARVYDISDLDRIDRWLAARDFKIDRKFASAVAIELWRAEPENPVRLARLDQLGLLDLVGRERLDAAFGKEQAMESGLACAKRSGAMLKQLIARTSVLTPQPTASFVSQQERCLKAFPEASAKHVNGLYRLARPYMGAISN